MEKALMKVSSLKAGSFWISSKAKEEFANITQDITVSSTRHFPLSFFVLIPPFFLFLLCILGNDLDRGCCSFAWLNHPIFYDFLVIMSVVVCLVSHRWDQTFDILLQQLIMGFVLSSLWKESEIEVG